jgi:hypothetical protein
MGEKTSGNTCGICGEHSDYICERCLRCENCCARQDGQRQPTEQHNGKFIWHRATVKGIQLRSLVTAGHGKGDYSPTAAKVEVVADAGR